MRERDCDKTNENRSSMLWVRVGTSVRVRDCLQDHRGWVRMGACVRARECVRSLRRVAAVSRLLFPTHFGEGRSNEDCCWGFFARTNTRNITSPAAGTRPAKGRTAAAPNRRTARPPSATPASPDRLHGCRQSAALCDSKNSSSNKNNDDDTFIVSVNSTVQSQGLV